MPSTIPTKERVTAASEYADGQASPETEEWEMAFARHLLDADATEEVLVENERLHAKVTRLHRLLGATMDLAGANYEEVRRVEKSLIEAMRPDVPNA